MINIPALFQIMALRRLSDKPLSEPMVVTSPTHMCVTRPQRVKLAKDHLVIPYAARTDFAACHRLSKQATLGTIMIFRDLTNRNIWLGNSKQLRDHPHGPLARYAKSRASHAPGMPGTFSPPPRVSDPDMHHDTCVTHVPWCIPWSLISDFLWSRWRIKRSRHSRRMRNA